jgi:DNA polymerase III epsilon subunit-like protein
MRPESPEAAMPEAMRVNGLNLDTLLIEGIDQVDAIDLLDAWLNKLDLPFTPAGHRKRITILGHNVSFDVQFMRAWLGSELFNEWFNYRVIDTCAIGAYLNDRAAIHANPIPFPKLKLSSLASTLGVENLQAHDALQDCITTAEVYRRLICQGIIG